MYFYQKKLFFINYANLKYLYLYKLVETFTFLSYFFMRNILSPSSNFYLYFENLSFLTNLLICTPLNEQNSFTECLETLYTHLRCFDIIFVQITKRQKTFFFFWTGLLQALLKLKMMYQKMALYLGMISQNQQTGWKTIQSQESY